jgi:UDP-N-acetylmuramoyl-L-alanyl-D-glutamate--2,6-diaminopimelate ligase
MIRFNKFPELQLRGRRLIWDSRQSEAASAEIVYLNSSASPDIESKLRARAGASEFVCDDVVSRLGRDASEAAGFPSRRLCVIGVTGTNGKTSGTHIMSYALSALGKRVLQIGTLGIQVWEKKPDLGGAHIVFSEETGFTTPEAPSLHDLFRQALEAGVTHVVMEVSSHALSLGRVSGVEFDGGIFTNLSQDHLDFHGTMESYGAAKRLLFSRELVASSKSKKAAILGLPDDLSWKLFAAGLGDLPGINRQDVRMGEYFSVEKSSLLGLQVSVRGQGKLQSSLIGSHNAWNLALSFAMLQALEGVSLSEFSRVMLSYPGIPGRFERIGSHCFVDYAHTPDALEKVLSTLRATVQGEEKVVVVFGCGGDRDRGKRPQMGRIAGHLADVVWVTSDNPRTEDPQSILDQIVAGVDDKDRVKLRISVDRSEAIRRALDESRSIDVVIVCGKGHENYQIIGTEKFPFSDQDCIRTYLKASSDSRG